MFTKALIFVLLGTNFVLANAFSREERWEAIGNVIYDSLSKIEVEYKVKIADLLLRYDDGKHLNKLSSYVRTLVSGDVLVAQLFKYKLAKLQQEYKEIQDKAQRIIPEQRQIFLIKIRKHPHNLFEYAEETKKGIKKEYSELEVNLKAWALRAEYITCDAQRARINMIFEHYYLSTYDFVEKRHVTYLRERYY